MRGGIASPAPWRDFSTLFGMNGLLVRVGIDSTDGEWNAPVRTGTGEFAYVTITDTKPLRDASLARWNRDHLPDPPTIAAVIFQFEFERKQHFTAPFLVPTRINCGLTVCNQPPVA